MTHGKEKVCAFSRVRSRRSTAASRGTFRPLRIRPCAPCERQGLAAAYAFLLRAPEAKSLLLLLYAVEPEMRGSGVGSDFLRTLLERASGAVGLYAEAEKEELAPGATERRTRAQRIAFYERLGFSRGEGLYYYLFYRPLADPRHPDAAPAAGAALSRLTGSKISSF